ncbi:hypothetical protein FRC02_000820 [Tulasnella sp. 418]|nr:hypothetical protein FRC02_000820 [Tulasnella sp. 418]
MPLSRCKRRAIARSLTTQGTPISELPLELWDITLRELQPQDVVSCMYAFKDVHTYLVSGDKSRVALWQSIFANHRYQPPKRPPHLTPGQYAEFLFGDRCMGCRTPSTNLRIHYPLFTRHCPTCYPQELVSSHWIINNLVDVASGERFPIKAILLKDEALPFHGKKTGVRYSLIQASTELQRYRRDCLENPALQRTGTERHSYLNMRNRDRTETENITHQAQIYVERYVYPTRPTKPWLERYD